MEGVCTSNLSEIEDSYVEKGFRGRRLEKTLAADKHYQQLLHEKRRGTKKLWKVASKKQLRKYPLPTKQDFEILSLANKLAEQKLSKQDAEIVELVLSQLEHDWRKHLQQKLRKMEKKYESKSAK